ncbi:hypothetical protein MYSTI_01853 [Myxococcus stipitatus DSM 14675]|uniref:Uncharacterized protein n=1 Tax=Myxococcus stipitatus (strain DSM 14675 / JCM 12634 / Mx s8) TaxID=1278073 RepID=L7U5Q3_MYXSD|nr:hypothetical protein [Myxococcus stipitatus]AGC43185.1 hypothetical protein MYSTI_01853 [Myxococcus stipitatus DSM 14675]
MHDVDRTYQEQEDESFEFEFNTEEEWGEVFNESELNELAMELLEVGNDQELEQFLGSLIKKAGSAIRKVVSSPTGQALGAKLKSLAKQGLVAGGRAVGNMVLPGLGGAVGGKLGQRVGQAFGLELEGLSQEDREFEVAKQFVRLAGNASRAALSAGEGASPQQAVGAAMQQAIQRYAPGLAGAATPPRAGTATSGRWVRKGNKIILHGV